MAWNALPAGRLGATADLPGIDANLVWADASKWRDFLRPGQRKPELIPVIAEIDPQRGKEFAASITKPNLMPKVYRSNGTTHCTALLTVAQCRDVLRAWADGGPVRRLELQAPLIPQRPRADDGREPRRTTPGEKTEGELLIGVIDHGCPFAHRHLRDATTGGTRILNLWLQDRAHPRRTLQRGAAPSDFGYGLVLSRNVLNGLMEDHTADDGFVNEDACYAEAGLGELRQRFLHGAAVLDLFVGPRPLVARTSADPDRSPTWKIEGDAGTKAADIVFVQLPRDVVQDSSSAGLARCLLDGLQYIVRCAGKKTKRIVVNISDGSSRGSHDGHSIIEKAMASLVDRDPRLSLVLPAGNSRDEERHAQFDTLPANKWRCLRLRLPPSCEAPSQLIIRIPTAIDGAEIRVVPPGEDPDARERDVVGWGEAKAWPVSNRPACAVILPQPGTMPTTEALITWAPTERFGDGVRAPAGDWQIAVRSRFASRKPVHFYIARNQINPTALFRGRQAFFVDEGGYDPDRYQRSRKDDPTPPRSPIRRRGSLNSLTTGSRGNGIVVVGSAFQRERTPTSYSSEGPAVGGEPPRQGPDFLAPTELSSALRGINASGTTGGQVVRVIGTSFAAPQVARALANDQLAGGRIPEWLMRPPMPTQIEISSGAHRTLVSLPTVGRAPHPVLCFLHGKQEHAANPEGGRTPFELLKKNLSPPGIAAGVIIAEPNVQPPNWAAARASLARFLIVSPQLPSEAVWGRRHARLIWQAVNAAIAAHRGDEDRIFLTGFSYGGIGALKVPDDPTPTRRRWRARWAVDPAMSANPKWKLPIPRQPPAGQRVLVHYGAGVKALKEWTATKAWIPVLPAGAPVANRWPGAGWNRGNLAFRNYGRGIDHPRACQNAYVDLDAYEWLLA